MLTILNHIQVSFFLFSFSFFVVKAQSEATDLIQTQSESIDLVQVQTQGESLDLVQTQSESIDLIQTTTLSSVDKDVKRKNNAKRDAEIVIPDNYSIHEPPPTSDGS